MNFNKTTEEHILRIARNVFERKGFQGARMQEIANEAGINKSLLHYYYRSKEKLFHNAYRKAFESMIPDVREIFMGQKPIKEKIRLFADSYSRFLMQNPNLPHFVLHELNRDPESLLSIIKEAGIDPTQFIGQIKKEMEAGNIMPMDPRQLMINILSMTIFPFIAKPIIMPVLCGNDQEVYKQLIEERKKLIPEFFTNVMIKDDN
ncbi:MAG: TetR/AcrR family transcriptional regulator [Bacteroidales bacterium]|nr:TetR/AcrR family transcriptional regulator [Bacteroidales bacterium]